MKFWCRSGSDLIDLDPEPASFFKDKKSKRRHKTVGIKIFLTILLDRRIRIRLIRIHTSDMWIRRPKNMWIRWIRNAV
jgi:hypothetical protein